MNKEIVKPSILPGFMELLPQDQILFNKILEKIQKVYERYGFIPIDTPVIEKSEVLLAKGGGETEKQVYRFNKGSSDLSLRFDLTVPLARYVAEHMSDLTFPFRRYQIGKVYRGERNQKGRFREFYQCDIDIIGNGKLNIINDAEIPSIIFSIFNEIGLKEFKIHINNRKIMNGVFEHFEVLNKVEALRIVDKIDKIGVEAVELELEKIDIPVDNIKRIIEFINIKGNNDEILNSLKKLEISNTSYIEGVQELSKVIHYMRCFGVPDKNFIIDLKITRGLDYYTGTVYETMLDKYPQIGSVCSGGRYDNLAEYYTKEELPGVGISIGLTRLFYQLKEAGIIESKGVSTLTEVLVIPVDDSLDYSINVASKLREEGIISEVYFEEGKISKKLNYGNKLGISNIILIGSEEVKSNILTLKDMSTGNQYKLTIDKVIEKIKN